MNTANVWRGARRRSIVLFLLAVFLLFASFGFVSDMTDLGNVPTVRFVWTTLLSGLFAVSYAVSGITLRRQFWKAFFPSFALQFVVMGFLNHRFPDAPWPLRMGPAEIGRLQHRLDLDGTATTIAVTLAYAGLAYVLMSEGRRNILVQTEMTRLEGEMAAAREVQQLIVPEKSESFPGFKVESAYRPAQQVGGDFFQILPAAGGGLLIVVGDVAGKGLPAAMLVSVLVGSIRTAAEDTQDPALILRKLNDGLVNRTRGGFCTALAAHISADGWVTVANAGHLSPYLDGEEVELPGALPLGLAIGQRYEAETFQFPYGSRLTFYSDGVVEAQNGKGELFGFKRAQAISTQPAAAIAEAAKQFGQEDDITVVTIERLAVTEEAAVLAFSSAS